MNDGGDHALRWWKVEVEEGFEAREVGRGSRWRWRNVSLKKIDALQVMARRYEITWDRDVLARFMSIYDQTGQPSHPYAACVKAERTICMNPDMIMTPDEALECLFHEGGEALLDFLGVTMKHDTFRAFIALLTNMAIQSGILVPGEFVIAGVKISDLKPRLLRVDE